MCMFTISILWYKYVYCTKLSVNVSNDIFDTNNIYCSLHRHALMVCLASSSWLDLINVKALSNIDTLRCVSLWCTDDEK